MSTTRRVFVGGCLGTAAAASVGLPLQAAAKSNESFARVKDIPESVRRIPSDSYPLPFSDAEYKDRLRKTRELMEQMEIDLLYVTLPEGMCYLHGYEVTWYRAHSPKHW